MTTDQIRRRAFVTFVIGAHLLLAMVVMAFVVYPVLNAHGWIEHRITVDYSTTEESHP